jgi:hypothetical protein
MHLIWHMYVEYMMSFPKSEIRIQSLKFCTEISGKKINDKWKMLKIVGQWRSVNYLKDCWGHYAWGCHTLLVRGKMANHFGKQLTVF